MPITLPVADAAEHEIHDPSEKYVAGVSVVLQNDRLFTPNNDVDGTVTPIPFVEGTGVDEWHEVSARQIATLAELNTGGVGNAEKLADAENLKTYTPAFLKEFLTAAGIVRVGLDIIPNADLSLQLTAGYLIRLNDATNELERIDIAAQNPLVFDYQFPDGSISVAGANALDVTNYQAGNATNGLGTNARAAYTTFYVNASGRFVALYGNIEHNNIERARETYHAEAKDLTNLNGYTFLGGFIHRRHAADLTNGVTDNRSTQVIASKWGEITLSSGTSATTGIHGEPVANLAALTALTGMINGETRQDLSAVIGADPKVELYVYNTGATVGIEPDDTVADTGRWNLLSSETSTEWIDVAADAQVLEEGKKYALNGHPVTFPDHATNTKPIEVWHNTAFIGGNALAFAGTFVSSSDGSITAGTGIGAGFKDLFIPTAAGWVRAWDNTDATVAISTSNAGEILSPSVTYLVTTTADTTFPLGAFPVGKVTVALTRDSTHPLTIEQSDTGAAPIISNNGGVLATQVVIHPTQSGALKTLVGDGSLWTYLEPAIANNYSHITTTFDYSQHVSDEAIPNGVLTTRVNTTGGGLSIALDGTKDLLIYDPLSQLTSTGVASTGYTMRPRSQVNMYHDDNFVYVDYLPNRDWGVLTEAEIKAIHPNALRNGAFATDTPTFWVFDQLSTAVAGTTVLVPDTDTGFGRWLTNSAPPKERIRFSSTETINDAETVRIFEMPAGLPANSPYISGQDYEMDFGNVLTFPYDPSGTVGSYAGLQAREAEGARILGPINPVGDHPLQTIRVTDGFNPTVTQSQLADTGNIYYQSISPNTQTLNIIAFTNRFIVQNGVETPYTPATFDLEAGKGYRVWRQGTGNIYIMPDAASAFTHYYIDTTDTEAIAINRKFVEVGTELPTTAANGESAYISMSGVMTVNGIAGTTVLRGDVWEFTKDKWIKIVDGSAIQGFPLFRISQPPTNIAGGTVISTSEPLTFVSSQKSVPVIATTTELGIGEAVNYQGNKSGAISGSVFIKKGATQNVDFSTNWGEEYAAFIINPAGEIQRPSFLQGDDAIMTINGVTIAPENNPTIFAHNAIDAGAEWRIDFVLTPTIELNAPARHSVFTQGGGGTFEYTFNSDFRSGIDTTPQFFDVTIDDGTATVYSTDTNLGHLGITDGYFKPYPVDVPNNQEIDIALTVATNGATFKADPANPTRLLVQANGADSVITLAFKASVFGLYRGELETLAELTALPQADLPNGVMYHVTNFLYVWDANGTNGDAEPDDKANQGVDAGYWKIVTDMAVPLVLDQSVEALSIGPDQSGNGGFVFPLTDERNVPGNITGFGTNSLTFGGGKKYKIMIAAVHNTDTGAVRIDITVNGSKYGHSLYTEASLNASNSGGSGAQIVYIDATAGDIPFSMTRVGGAGNGNSSVALDIEEIETTKYVAAQDVLPLVEAAEYHKVTVGGLEIFTPTVTGDYNVKFSGGVLFSGAGVVSAGIRIGTANGGADIYNGTTAIGCGSPVANNAVPTTQATHIVNLTAGTPYYLSNAINGHTLLSMTIDIKLIGVSVIDSDTVVDQRIIGNILISDIGDIRTISGTATGGNDNIVTFPEGGFNGDPVFVGATSMNVNANRIVSTHSWTPTGFDLKITDFNGGGPYAAEPVSWFASGLKP